MTNENKTLEEKVEKLQKDYDAILNHVNGFQDVVKNQIDKLKQQILKLEKRIPPEP